MEELENKEGMEQEEEEQGGGEEVVTLSRDVYENLLNQLTESANASKAVLSKVEQEEARIKAEEDAQLRALKATKFDDAKTPGELAGMIRDAVMEEVQEFMYPVASTVMQIVVAEEVKTMRTKYADFDKFGDQVYNLTKDNTKLSIEDAYLIASGKGKEGDAGKKEEKARDTKPVMGGERPSGAGSNAMTKNSPQTVKDAVRMAREQVMGKSG